MFDDVLAAYGDEAAGRILDGTCPPFLLATPTHASGSLDPRVLLEQLGQYRRSGMRPGEADFEQAFVPPQARPGFPPAGGGTRHTGGASLGALAVGRRLSRPRLRADHRASRSNVQTIRRPPLRTHRAGTWPRVRRPTGDGGTRIWATWTRRRGEPLGTYGARDRGSHEPDWRTSSPWPSNKPSQHPACPRYRP
ncbi:DUF7824 domain-containing protein [Streptomyces collinus]|uniref:DUF7824 domain-containing protein n=1 Tax=Streptomyces TaxID=1883 RepID=UPI003D9E69C8